MRLLTSTQAAAKAGLSAKAFNELLYKNKILNKRGRPSKKNPKLFKPFWDLLDTRYGRNIASYHNVNNVRWYESMLPELFEKVGLGGLV